MICTITKPSREVGVIRPLFEHTDRVKIRAELAALNGALRAPFYDTKSKEIFLWHGEFVQRLNLAGMLVNPVIDEFAERLKALLVDTKEGALLEDPLLGSDGCVYGRKALCSYLFALDNAHKGRSPIYPEDETLFFAIAHPIVKAAIDWLKARDKWDARHTSLDVIYERLECGGQLPEIPQSEQRARRLHRVRQIRQERENVCGRAEIARGAADFVQTLFTPLREALDRVEGDERDRFNEVLARDEENGTAGEALRRLIEELRTRNDALDARVESLKEEVKEVSAKTTILKNEIEAAEAAKSASSGGFWQEVGLVVGCAVLSYVTGQVVFDKVPGGMMFGFIKPI